MSVVRWASKATFVAGLVAIAASLSLPAHAQSPDTTHYPKVLRYQEDYSYLADPAQRTDAWDHLKYIPLGHGGRTYLSFGGEWRERYEYLDGYLTNPDPDHIVMHRLMLSADLHVGDAFRTFVQISHLSQSGRDGGSIATDENKFDFQQAFFDVSAALSADERATLRVGRHEMVYGSGRFVAIREGPNSRRSFDGVRINYTSSNFQLDGFVTRPVTILPGGFDDKPNTDQAFWGVYSVTRYTPGHALDLYYFGNDYERSNYVEGTESERRHTIGLRLWGKEGAFDYNLEPVYQFGDFGDLTISAWGVALDVGWTFAALPFKPRLGVKANIEAATQIATTASLARSTRFIPTMPISARPPSVRP